jgi:hypothetical protein
MTMHAYSTGALAGDYARAAAGFTLVTAPIALVPLSLTVAGLLGLGSVLFAAFGLRTAVRQMRRLELTEDGIAVVGLLPASLSWDEVEEVRLAYYSTRRDRREGWMQLTLRGRGRTLRLDSRIAGFETIVAKAAQIAAQRGLPLSPSTTANFGALGIAA